MSFYFRNIWKKIFWKIILNISCLRRTEISSRARTVLICCCIPRLGYLSSCKQSCNQPGRWARLLIWWKSPAYYQKNSFVTKCLLKEWYISLYKHNITAILIIPLHSRLHGFLFFFLVALRFKSRVFENYTFEINFRSYFLKISLSKITRYTVNHWMI